MPGIFIQIKRVKQFLFFFTTKLRLSNPWRYKVPFLIAVPYFVFLLAPRPVTTALQAIPLSISIILGVAGIGYLSNDLGDKKKDALIQKPNSTANLNFFSLLVLFAVFFLLAVLPWLYLPCNYLSVCLLFTQFILFFSYAMPPFRLKERGFLGVMADSLYAHTNPALLAAYTFYLLNAQYIPGFTIFLILLCTWQFTLGIRNIMLHQVADLENDRQADTATFATIKGKHRTGKLIADLILPLEVILFMCFSVFISLYFNFFLPAVLLYWLWTYFIAKRQRKNMNYRDYAYTYLDNLYIQWIPLVVLLGLMFRSLQFTPLFILHILIFRNAIKSALLKLFPARQKTGK